jgi:hypothetical protein
MNVWKLDSFQGFKDERKKLTALDVPLQLDCCVREPRIISLNYFLYLVK